MEVDKSKCLICEVSCNQKGLAFFKFPKEESRLKMWVKEISPLLDILKVTSESLKENGRICARHFREKDFINCKQNSLVHNACPSLSVSNLNLNSQKEGELNTESFDQEESLDMNEQSNDSNEKDIFQCGRCKSQFQHLSEFMDHKRFHCQKTSKKTVRFSSPEQVTSTLENSPLSLENNLLNGLDNKLLETFPVETVNKTEEVVKIVSEESSGENKIVSFVVNENGVLVGNSLDFSTVPTQLILTPQLPLCYNGVVVGNSVDLSSLAGQVILTPQIPLEGNSVFLNNGETEGQVNSLIITTEGASNPNGGIVYSCPIQSSSINNSVVITSKVPNSETGNQVVLTTDISTSPSDSIEELEPESQPIYCELTNAIDASQQNSSSEFSPIGGEQVTENTNQIAESDFEKPKTKLPCSYCGKSFEKPFNLQQHERVHTGERPFQCIICGRAFTQKSNVRKHMMRHRVWPQGKQTLKITPDNSKKNNEELAEQMSYSCQYCSSTFKSYSEHKKHLAVHSDFKVYRCIQKGCNETFGDLDEFLSHSKMHSSAEFRCHICLKTFTSLEELGAHQYDHDTTDKDKNEVRLKCKVCHARFKTAESLKNHVAVDTHNYECIHCHSVFSTERFLRRHLFIHLDSSKSKYKCQNCKKTFRTQQNLKSHVFIHLKEKPFTCDHCDKQFASKYRLKRHLAVHLNQYFECPFKKHLSCEKTFYRKDKLRDHVNTHSHCRLRSCRMCTKMYWTLSKLKEHMKREHKVDKGNQVLKCGNCSQTFRKQKQLSQHHCTVGERKFRSRARNSEGGGRGVTSEAVSNIEIIMVPFGTECTNEENLT